MSTVECLQTRDWMAGGRLLTAMAGQPGRRCGDGLPFLSPSIWTGPSCLHDLEGEDRQTICMPLEHSS